MTDFYRLHITIGDPGTTISNYVLRVFVPSSLVADETILTNGAGAGAGVRFFSTAVTNPYDDSTPDAARLEYYQTPENLREFFVKIPTLTSGQTSTIYMFYGRTTWPSLSTTSIFRGWGDGNFYPTQAEYTNEGVDQEATFSVSSYGACTYEAEDNKSPEMGNDQVWKPADATGVTEFWYKQYGTEYNSGPFASDGNGGYLWKASDSFDLNPAIEFHGHQQTRTVNHWNGTGYESAQQPIGPFRLDVGTLILTNIPDGLNTKIIVRWNRTLSKANFYVYDYNNTLLGSLLNYTVTVPSNFMLFLTPNNDGKIDFDALLERPYLATEPAVTFGSIYTQATTTPTLGVASQTQIAVLRTATTTGVANLTDKQTQSRTSVADIRRTQVRTIPSNSTIVVRSTQAYTSVCKLELVPFTPPIAHTYSRFTAKPRTGGSGPTKFGFKPRK